jgi:HAE1 family hydrophobic/amphiphilic exporter-1
MTSLAFILGVIPLMIASGAAAESRKTIGWTVFGGMLAATSLAIFVVPVLFILITRWAYGKEGLAKLEQQRQKGSGEGKKDNGIHPPTVSDQKLLPDSGHHLLPPTT